jgi:hypothetical protein
MVVAITARIAAEAITISVSNFLQANDDARRFGRVCSQSCKAHIAPISKPYHLSFLNLHPRNFEQLQHVKSSVVEKESMTTKQFAELRDCEMILDKYQCWKLRQDFANLDFA